MMRTVQPRRCSAVCRRLYAGLLANPYIMPLAPARPACAAASRPGKRCRRISACVGNPSSALISWMASAPPRCCTSSSATGPDDIRYGTSGKPVPRLRGPHRRRTRPPGAARRGRRADGQAATARPTATGTSAPRPAAPSRANGPTPATPTRAMTPTATSASRAAATRC